MDNVAVRILLIEDDPDDYYLTRELLADIPGNKFELEWVRDFDAGLETLARREHDACLLDYRLGKGDGLKLLREGLRCGYKAPVILLTGQEDRELALQALEAGAADYLVKGKIDGVALERAIRYSLQQKRHADELEQKVADRTAELRASEERYRLMIEGATGFAIMMLDLEGRVSTWNVGAERLFGYADTEILGGHFARFFTAEDAAAERPARELRQARDKERGDDDNWLVRKDDSRFWASGATTALHDETGRLRGYAKIVRDLSERKWAEEALQEADHRKDEFLATLAHELRNPLAPLRNGLQILRLAGAKNAAGEQIQEMLERQLQQMVRLVDDLLDVSRITLGKIELRKQRVELTTIVSNAVETSRPLIEQSGHELTVALPSETLWLDADPIRLTQVVANLLNNAAKYTKEGGRIDLSVERQDGEIALRVRDSGIGIPAEQLPRVFEMFTQVDSSLGRSQGGLGIGLTLVKTLVRMHGGSVEAASAGLGQGSEFVVRLPLAADPTALDEDKPTADEPSQSLSPRRILVVDDNVDAAISLGLLLKMMGADVRTAHDGSTALEAARAYRPHMVMLDIGLPGMNGYEVARRLRQVADLRGTLLVAVTGWGQEEDRQRAHESGFDHHLTKPAELAELKKLLASLASKP